MIAHDARAGLAVIEDLGDDLFAAHRTGLDEIYGAAVDALAHLHALSPPDVIEAGGERWPLHLYDAQAYRAGLDPFLEWWPRFAGLPAPDGSAAAEWSALWAPVIARGVADRPVFGVTLVSGSRREALAIDRLYASASDDPGLAADLPYCDCEVLLDRTYFLPLGDATWPDDTRVGVE